MQQYNKSDLNSILKGYNMLFYFAGSMIMYEPTEECVTDFWTNGIVRRLPVKSTNPRFIEAASQLRYSCENPDICQSLLMKDYDLLFSKEGQMLAPPVKSFFSSKNKADSEGAQEKVSDFYNSYGWRFRSKYQLSDEHLSIELLFLTLLTDKLHLMDDDACFDEMCNEIRRFISRHIISWLPEWNNLVQNHAGTLCYKGIANLVFAACEDIYNLLEPAANNRYISDHFRN